MKKPRVALADDAREELRTAIAEFARKMAGSRFDLDPVLEAAAVEELLASNTREG